MSKTPLQDFDAATATVTTERGKAYGHPADDFQKVVDLAAVTGYCEDPLIRHVLYMLGVKMARLTTTPDHLDSWIDIAGYARTAVMILERRLREDEARPTGINRVPLTGWVTAFPRADESDGPEPVNWCSVYDRECKTPDSCAGLGDCVSLMTLPDDPNTPLG